MLAVHEVSLPHLSCFTFYSLHPRTKFVFPEVPPFSDYTHAQVLSHLLGSFESWLHIMSEYGEGKIQCGSTAAPATVLKQDGTLCVFHQGMKSCGWLFYTTRNSDGSFAEDTGVPRTGMSFSPGPVLYQGNVYVFHHGRGENGQLWVNCWSRPEWNGDNLVAERCISGSPRAIVYKEKLYVFYEGYNGDGTLRYRTLDTNYNLGAEQIVPNCKISYSPSPVVFNGKIVVFYQGRDQEHDKVLHWNEFDGSSWSGDKTHQAWAWVKERLAAPPCPVVVGDQIWLFYYSGMRGGGYMNINFRIMASDGNWDFYNRQIGVVGGW